MRSGVLVARFIRADAGFAFQAPTVAVVIEFDGGHHLFLTRLMNFPTAHVMAAGDNSRLDAFRHPRAHDEISDLSFDADQIAGTHAEFRGVTRVQPQRVRVRNLIQPFRVRAARVNLNRQPEGWKSELSDPVRGFAGEYDREYKSGWRIRPNPNPRASVKRIRVCRSG
jgi:hypothetical protein